MRKNKVLQNQKEEWDLLKKLTSVLQIYDLDYVKKDEIILLVKVLKADGGNNEVYSFLK